MPAKHIVSGHPFFAIRRVVSHETRMGYMCCHVMDGRSDGDVVLRHFVFEPFICFCGEEGQDFLYRKGGYAYGGRYGCFKEDSSSEDK